MEQELNRILEELKNPQQSTSQKSTKSKSVSSIEHESDQPFPGATKLNQAIINGLATDEDVAYLANLYAEHFPPPTSEALSLQDQHSSLGFQLGERIAGADPGIEVETSLTYATLANNLGFIDGCPVLFNTHRHRAGLTPWDQAHATLFQLPAANDNPDLEPFRLLWSQLAGIHSMVRTFFTSKPDQDRCLGMLVADEVGLGKTFQAAGLIAFLTDLEMRQGMQNTPLPPIIRKLHFVRIPSLPKCRLPRAKSIPQGEHSPSKLSTPGCCTRNSS
jgi:TATA-binding protein-associated factor